MIRKYTQDPSYIVDWGGIVVDTNGNFEEGPVCIMDYAVKFVSRNLVTHKSFVEF